MDFSGLADACRAQGGGGGGGVGGGGVGGGKEEGALAGCVVDPDSRFNDRSVAPRQGNLQQPLTVGKGPTSGSLQGPPATLQGPSGTLQGPSGTFEGPEETMADLTLSRTPHSLKKVTNNQKISNRCDRYWLSNDIAAKFQPHFHTDLISRSVTP